MHPLPEYTYLHDQVIMDINVPSARIYISPWPSYYGYQCTLCQNIHISMTKLLWISMYPLPEYTYLHDQVIMDINAPSARIYIYPWPSYYGYQCTLCQNIHISMTKLLWISMHPLPSTYIHDQVIMDINAPSARIYIYPWPSYYGYQCTLCQIIQISMTKLLWISMHPLPEYTYIHDQVIMDINAPSARIYIYPWPSYYGYQCTLCQNIHISMTKLLWISMYPLPEYTYIHDQVIMDINAPSARIYIYPWPSYYGYQCTLCQNIHISMTKLLWISMHPLPEYTYIHDQVIMDINVPSARIYIYPWPSYYGYQCTLCQNIHISMTKLLRISMYPLPEYTYIHDQVIMDINAPSARIYIYPWPSYYGYQCTLCQNIHISMTKLLWISMHPLPEYTYIHDQVIMDINAPSARIYIYPWPSYYGYQCTLCQNIHISMTKLLWISMHPLPEYTYIHDQVIMDINAPSARIYIYPWPSYYGYQCTLYQNIHISMTKLLWISMHPLPEYTYIHDQVIMDINVPSARIYIYPWPSYHGYQCTLCQNIHISMTKLLWISMHPLPEYTYIHDQVIMDINAPSARLYKYPWPSYYGYQCTLCQIIHQYPWPSYYGYQCTLCQNIHIPWPSMTKLLWISMHPLPEYTYIHDQVIMDINVPSARIYIYPWPS